MFETMSLLLIQALSYFSAFQMRYCILKLLKKWYALSVSVSLCYLWRSIVLKVQPLNLECYYRVTTQFLPPLHKEENFES